MSGNSNFASTSNRRKGLVSSPERPDGLCVPPSLPLGGWRASCVEVKGPGREFDHALPSNVKVKNGWSHASASQTKIHGVDRGKNATIFVGVYIQNKLYHNLLTNV